jgi:hypothetical protein
MQLARWGQVIGAVMIAAAVLWFFVPRWTGDETAASPQVEGTCTVVKERVLAEGIRVTKAPGSSTKYNSDYYRDVAVTVTFQAGGREHRYETKGVDQNYTPGQQCRCWYDPAQPSLVSLVSPEMETLYADLGRGLDATALLVLGVLLIVGSRHLASKAKLG